MFFSDNVMASDANPLEVLFPLKGVNVATEFELQPDLTTPLGINVRAYEPLTLRMRGGSRPGLTKYIAGQIPEGAELIQHLNIVVDPTILALITTFNDFDPGGGQDDPSSDNDPLHPRQPVPKRRVRVGGNGQQPNRHIGADHQPPVPPWPPPPPPPPPITCDKLSVHYNVDPAYHLSFNLQVPDTDSCPCDPDGLTGFTISSDLGGTAEQITNDQAVDLGFVNGRILDVTGLTNGVTSIDTTVNGECSGPG